MDLTSKSEKQLLLTYLDEVFQSESAKLVGKVMKRMELIQDRDILKKDVREVIYEQFREIRDIFYAYSSGIEMTKFIFKQSMTKAEEK